MKFTYLSIIGLILFVSCGGGSKKLSYGNLEVYYTETVTTYEAEDVGDYLSGIGFGVGDEKEMIELSKNEDRYLVKFVMPDGEVKLESIYKRYGQGISQKALKGAPVDVELSDLDFTTLKFLGSD